MNKSTAFLISLVCLLAGIIAGFVLSPAKFGFGNNINSHNYENHGQQEEQEILKK